MVRAVRCVPVCLLLGISMLFGCVGPVPSAPIAVPKDPVMRSDSSAEDLLPAEHRCDTLAPKVFVTATPADSGELSCADKHRECSGRLYIEILNCTPSPVNPTGIRLVRTGTTSVTYISSGARLEAKGVFKVTARVGDAGAYELSAGLVCGDALIALPKVVVHFVNPTLDAALAACTACHGTWGKFGVLQLEDCNCRPKDAGKFCRDGDECEGKCIPDGVEIVTKPKTDPANPRGTGRHIGHCSDRMTVFGCHNEIRRGESKKPPERLPLRSSRICSD